MFVAVMALMSCEPVIIVETKPDVVYYFSTINVETSENSATIEAVKPYITVDDVKVEDPEIYLVYWVESNQSDATRVDEYTESNGYIIFELDGLKEDTEYLACISVGSEYGKETCAAFPVVTKKHIPVTSISCSAEVAPKGLMATVNLSDVAYLVDGEPHDIHVVKLEYSRQSPEEWFAYEFSGSALDGGAMSIELPFEGRDYLVENRNYSFRVTIYPTNGDYEPITSDIFSFKTNYAEVTANIATPQLSVDGEGIHAVVENIEVFYDGVAAELYEEGYPIEYYFNYRMKDAEQWSQIEAYDEMGDIRITIPASELEEGATYEVEVRIVAGAQRKVRQSEVAEITVPVSTPPTPPVGGEGDTSTITGTWHLTSWRGAEPSFDIYLDITEDGVVTLWQRLESREWECFYSNATIVNGIITGRYTDGVMWGASYNVTVADTTMTWVDTTDATDISVYTRSSLPEGLATAAKRASVAAKERFL